MSRARPLRRVGHKGADLIEKGNTLASFDAALGAGVDMIEFDVLPERWLEGDSDLFLAHDYGDLKGRPRVPLATGLDHLASAAFAGVELDVDLKGTGYELRVMDALAERGLLGRVLVTTQYAESLDLIRSRHPEVRLGLSVPKLMRDPFRRRVLLPPAVIALLVYRAALPLRMARLLRRGRIDAVMSHWRLVTPRLVRAVERAGGELYVWTVDEGPRIRSLDRMGVTGVITNDPRLFAGAPEPAPTPAG